MNGTELLLVGRSSQARLTDSLRSLFRGLWVAIPLAAIISALLAGIATAARLAPGRRHHASSRTPSAPPPTAPGCRCRTRRTRSSSSPSPSTRCWTRIDHGRVVQRQFTSDAAHELRTPLMALQGELELVHGRPDTVDDDTLGRLEALSRRLGDRIDDLVLLSTLDEARPLSLSPVSLLDLARDEAVGMASTATVEGDDVTVAVDRDLAARAIRNLLSNAKRHARDRVVVRVVDDDGPRLVARRRRRSGHVCRPTGDDVRPLRAARRGAHRGPWWRRARVGHRGVRGRSAPRRYDRGGRPARRRQAFDLVPEAAPFTRNLSSS